MADTIMNHNMQIEVPSIIMRYHFDRYGNPVSFDRIQDYYINEYDQVVSLEEEPSQSYQVRVIGDTELREVKNEDEIDTDCFFVNYPQALIKFHPSMSKKMVTIMYKGIGNTKISANRIFLAVDGNGCITDTLDSFYKRIKSQTDQIEKLGGACLVITNLTKDIESGSNLHKLLQESIQLATPLEVSLGAKIEEGKPLLEDLIIQNTTASTNLTSLIASNNTASTNITNLNAAIQQSTEHVEAITGTNNPYVEITTAQWGEPNSDGEYVITVNHGLKSKDIVYDAWVNDEEAYIVGMKKLNINEVEVTSNTNQPMKIVFNVRSYGGFNDPVTNEKVDNLTTQLKSKANSENVYTKTEIDKKVVKIEKDIDNSSYINLIKNSTGYNRNTDMWKYDSGILTALRKDGQISGFALRFINDKTTDSVLESNSFDVEINNKTYTLSGWIDIPLNCKGAEIRIISTSENATNNGDVYSERLLTFEDGSGLQNFTTSFSIPDYSWNSAIIQIIHKGSSKNGLACNIDFGDLMLTKTKEKVSYKANPNELYTENIKVNDNGVFIDTNEGQIIADYNNGLYYEDKYGKHSYLKDVEIGVINHLDFKTLQKHTIQLPDRFKGKVFSVFAIPMGWWFPTGVSLDVLRSNTPNVSNINYNNATFDITYKINSKVRLNVNILYFVIA